MELLSLQGGDAGVFTRQKKKLAWMKYVNWRLAALAGVGGALLLYAILSMMTVYSSACTYVMTDGERYETVKLYPGSIEEACEKAGFQNVEVVSQKEDDGTVYLTLKESFDVSIQTSAQTLTVRTAPCTVGELLEQNGILVGPDDIVTPDEDAWLSDNAQIKVTRVTFQTVTETEAIPFEVEVTYSEQRLKGEQKILTYGEPGEKSISYRVEMHDGEEASREVVEEKEVKKPVNCVVEQGIREPVTTQEKQTVTESAPEVSSQPLPSTQVDNSGQELSTAGRSQVWSVPAGIVDDTENKVITAADGSSFSYSAVFDVTATAYHRIEDGGEITASGTVTDYGTIAVDPTVIPLGSRLYVVSNGGDQSWSYGPGLAEDTGGLIKGAKIDLFFMTGDEANDFGVRPAKVYILTD